METKTRNYVSYIRCSTSDQHLGLISQENIVKQYIEKNGGNLIAQFQEVETGTKKKIRIEIFRAIECAKKNKAILILAKLDRMSRNVSFISSLMDSGVEFLACDMPEANNFTIHIFSALAQQEAEMISTRTKNALAVLKSRGVKLGNPENLSKNACEIGASVRHYNSINNPNNIRAYALIKVLKEQGKNNKEIAKVLNDNEYQTVKGALFCPTAVRRLIIQHKNDTQIN